MGRRLTFGSMFTGAGGLDLGLERAGMECRWQVEIDRRCREVILPRRFPAVRRRWRDSATFPPGLIDEWRVDLVAGGDPCQRNSRAGGRSRSADESPAPDFLRAVAALRPGIVLRENPSRARRDAPWPWWRFRGCLESLGYAVVPFRFRACCVGADHQRERLFLLAMLPDPLRPGLEGIDPPRSHTVTLPDAIGGHPHPEFVELLMGFPIGHTE